jgi:uncharacterized secreted protein with C-terminal beta-propeller domain
MITLIKEENHKLKQVGFLNHLGKAEERIKAVRFMGDKGYIVTFKQTDPFYTIDLSNPSQPRKVGELFVLGFSTYLHDVGNNQILSIGKSADKDGRVSGIKMQLIDISDFANPSVISEFLFDKSIFSNSVYNHKAFTYRASDKLFAIATSDYNKKAHGFYAFKIVGKSIKKIAFIENKEYVYNGRSIIFSKENKDYLLMFNKNLNYGEIK